jgi:hypothetical protein
VQDNAHFAPHGAKIEANDVVDQIANTLNVRTRRLPGKVKWAHDNAAGVCVQPQFMVDEVNYGVSPLMCGDLGH